jgi:hypothetical protein
MEFSAFGQGMINMEVCSMWSLSKPVVLGIPYFKNPHINLIAVAFRCSNQSLPWIPAGVNR